MSFLRRLPCTPKADLSTARIPDDCAEDVEPQTAITHTGVCESWRAVVT